PQSSDDVPAPQVDPQAAWPVTDPFDPEEGAPIPEPRPADLPDSVPVDPGTVLPKNAGAVPIPEPNPRATSEDTQPSPGLAGSVEGSPLPPDLEDETPPETAPIPESNPRAATEKPNDTAPAEPAEPPPP